MGKPVPLRDLGEGSRFGLLTATGPILSVCESDDRRKTRRVIAVECECGHAFFASVRLIGKGSLHTCGKPECVGALISRTYRQEGRAPRQIQFSPGRPAPKRPALVKNPEWQPTPPGLPLIDRLARWVSPAVRERVLGVAHG